MGRLDELDLSLSLPKKKAKKRLEEEQRRLLDLRLRLAGLRGGSEVGPPLCIVFEGWDASGKGGAIKRLVQRLDPRHVRVRSFSAPTDDEKRHHWLWRFWPVLPGWGGMAVFDRSWYGRVLVERVEGFADRRRLGAGLHRDPRVRVDARRRGHHPGQVLDAHLRGGAAATVRGRARTTRSSRGSSPTRTGATARSGRRTPRPWRTCSTAPARRSRRGT